jgi:DUF1707 SHOCT-like domain
MAGPEHKLPAEGGRGRLRASHADRERVIGTLTAAYVYGLVTKEEFDTRVSQTFAARTYAELAMLTADIPPGLAPAPPPLRPAPAKASPPAHTSPGPGDRAFVATAALAGVLVFVAAFFAGNAMVVLPLVLGAFGSAFVSLCARRGARPGGQLPPQREVHGSPAAGHGAASAVSAELLPHVSKPRRTGNADAARRHSLRPQVSS